jgi:hypothetical protein
MDRLQMVPLVCGRPPFEAQLIAVRLGAEGIVWELRGGSSVYPVGVVDVLVATGDLELARQLLLADEVEAAFDDEASGAVPEEPSRWYGVLFGSLLIMSTGGFLLLRLFAL